MTSDDQRIAASEPSPEEYFSHVNECRALTEQVPEKFIFNTSKVKLTCFDVGLNYFAFGSNCGVLFIFNRRLNRSAAPLRTNSDEVITYVKLFSGESDLLAAGHKSGGLALLNFPSGKPGSTRKLEQTLLFDGHKGHVVTCIVWAEDGKKVFSADGAGVVVVTSVDFVHSVFQTTFVCLEHSYVIQLIHIDNLLAVCTSKRVIVIDESSLNSILEIDDHQQKATSIHMATGPCGVELFILLSDGIVITYDISSGEKKKSFSLPEDVTQKYPPTDISDENRSQERKPYMLAVHPQMFVVTYNCYVVLLNFEKEPTALSSFDVYDIFHNESAKQMCYFCVDPKASWPTVYVLSDDNRVFRLSSDEAPSYLTEAHEIPEEFSARNFLTSFQKTAMLLPYTSKDALWGGLKVAKEMNVFSSLHNFPLPILSAVIDSNSIPQNTSDNSACDESSDSDSETKKMANNAVTRDVSSTSKNFEQMRIQPSNIMENVNKVARKLIDSVGGFGAQAEDGFLVQPVYEADVVGAEETLFPVEQSGVLQEIVVHRTKTASASKRKKIEEEEKIEKSNLITPFNEDFSPVDEHALKNIREVLTFSSQNANLDTKPEDKIHDDVVEDSAERITACSEDTEEVVKIGEQNGDIDRRSEEHDSVTERPSTENVTSLSVTEQTGKEDAYEFLMKNAIERRAPVVEGAIDSVISRPDAEQLVKEIAVVNNFGDIWSEIKLPYSCLSFSVSSQYIIICHSKKRKRPRYLSLPYCGTPQWITLKQKAENFVVNDRGTLVWKIHKNVAYAPTEGSSTSSSFPTTVHWTAVAGEGGGVIEVALTSDSAWYVTKSGEVYVQLRLPEMGILSRCETAWPLHSITASEVAVWALQTESGRLVVRAGLKHSPVGLDWVEVVPHGPARLTSIWLHGQSGWAIDEKRSLWFTNGVGFQSPFGSSGSWMKVYNPWDVSPDTSRLRSLQWIIRVSSAGVFVCVDHKCYWASGRSMLSGHRLEHVVPDKLVVDDNFELIAGGGLNDEDVDSLTLCRANEIFLYRLKNSYFYSLPAFPASFGSDVVEFSSFDKSVYILDSSGCIYVKENISTVSPFGTEWKVLDTGPCGSPVISFAVTSVSLWAVTVAGEACLFVKKEKKEPFIGTNPAWIHVKVLAGCTVDKIRASSNGTYVWIFSRSSGRAWARSYVSEALPFGKSWVEASDEPGVHELAVGCKVIWSLSTSGLLHRLQGLAIGNPAGNYWKSVPLTLKTITLDRKDRLWGIDMDGRLVSHKVELYPPSSAQQLDGSLKHNSINSETFDEYVSF